VYFADDDNTYSLDLFEAIRGTEKARRRMHASLLARLLVCGSIRPGPCSVFCVLSPVFSPLAFEGVFVCVCVCVCVCVSASRPRSRAQPQFLLRAQVSVFTVAFSGGVSYESPKVKDVRAIVGARSLSHFLSLSLSRSLSRSLCAVFSSLYFLPL
jgi:hypothetical protein